MGIVLLIVNAKNLYIKMTASLWWMRSGRVLVVVVLQYTFKGILCFDLRLG